MNDSVTLRELAAAEHVSERTMTKYIEQLNKELQSAAQIVEKHRRYYLHVDDYQQLAKLQTGHLKKRLDFNDVHKRFGYILKQLFQHQDYITLDHLAEDLIISKMTLNRDLKQLRTLLAPYRAEIKSMTNNGIKLVIKEDYEAPIIIDDFIADYFDLQSEDYAPQRGQLMKILQPLGLDDRSTKLIVRNALVLNYAVTNHYRIEHPIPKFARLWQDNQIIQIISNSIKTVLNQSLTEFEMDFILSPLTFKANEWLKPELVNQQLDRNWPLFLKLPDKYGIKNHINYLHFYQQIKYHFLFLINRTLFHTKTNQLLPGSLLTKYPTAYDLAQGLVSIIEDYLGVAVNQAEFGYLVLYFEMELEDQQKVAQPEFEVAIVGQVGSSVIRFIKHQLSEIFDDEVVVTVFSDARQLNSDENHYLLIFSDKPINYHDETTPVVRISAAFRVDELRGKLQASLVEKDILNGTCHFNYWRFENGETYLTGVQHLIKTRIADGELTEDFLTAWWDREAQGSCVFENGIAMPHVVDRSSKPRILLQIGVFQRPVKYQDREVQMVFLIGIPNNLNHLLSKTLSEVYDLVFQVASNQNIYQGLLNFDPEQRFTQITEGI